MPKKKAEGGLLAKYSDKLRTAFEAHKGDETEFSSFGDLPPGITNGVAQVVTCKFDQYKSGEGLIGEYYFQAEAIVVSPRKHAGIRVAGKRTRIGPEPLCNTPQRKSRPTTDDHVQWILNEMRKMGADTEDMEPEDLEDTAQAIQEEQPYISFRTWQGKATDEYPNPRVNSEWNGVVEDFDPDSVEEGEEEEEMLTERPPPNGRAAKAAATAPAATARAKAPPATATAAAPGKPAPPAKAPNASATAAKPGKAAKPAKEEVPTPEENFDDTGDLDSLAEAADADDQEAQNALTEQAIELGVTEKQLKKAKNWAAVVALIMEAKGTEEEAEEGEGEEADEEASEEGEEAGEGEDEEEPEYVPAKGDIIGFKPVDPKTKKPARKATEHEVLSVNTGKKLVTLKSLDSGKILLGADKKPLQVSWDDLEPVED
jgi:hypothetical protein